MSSSCQKCQKHREASILNIKLDEPDALFAALTAERDRSEDWEEDHRIRDEELDRALAPYLEQPPSILMRWLVDHADDLTIINHGSTAWKIMVRLARGPHPDTWLRAALDHGLTHSTSPLISTCVNNDVMTVRLATELLGDTEGYDDFDEWEESARELSNEHRFEFWERVWRSPMARNLFWGISSGEPEWITEAVSDPTFPMSLPTLLHAPRFQFGKRGIETLEPRLALTKTTVNPRAEAETLLLRGRRNLGER
ncbi:hypothetical protein KEM60_00435 [Austwickia sp. TVS 96-490-7B]|uniref:hypothetical protein n=1 Tax=Austwickia sp. TVS 96-490-7B TaxID=2830843 RepID=UPI001C55A302|nr:hypothetical protein [Austwickia sp. TVS 96-490-7B]MBW3084248.1 hypothetical protein [Austwickia sp. TVS 96-490-7B]